MRCVRRLLGITQLFATVQHPQTDGLTERLNQTIKGMLAKATAAHPRSWDQCIDAILFALRESPQASLGFSPFELVYGRKPWGLLEVLEGRGGVPGEHEEHEGGTYVAQLHQHLETVWQLARENLGRAQAAQKKRYDRGTQVHQLQVGDSVLVSRQAMANPTRHPWQGLFKVVQVLGPLSYEVWCNPGRRGTKHLHVNDLRQWVPRAEAADPDEGGNCNLQDPGELCEGGLLWRVSKMDGDPPVMDADLTPAQAADVTALLHWHPEVFSKRPGYTTLVKHAIPTNTGQVARARWHPIPYKTRDAVDREVKEMLHMDIIEPSQSA